MCKGPEAGTSMACGQDNVTGAGTKEEGTVEHEGKEASSHFESCGKKSENFLRSVRNHWLFSRQA